MSTVPIDLSAGFVPKPAKIDLSAGFVPKPAADPAAQAAALSGLPAPAPPGGSGIDVQRVAQPMAPFGRLAQFVAQSAPGQFAGGLAKEAGKHLGSAAELIPQGSVPANNPVLLRYGVTPQELEAHDREVRAGADALRRLKLDNGWQKAGGVAENIGEAILGGEALKPVEGAALALPRVARFATDAGPVARGLVRATVGAGIQGAAGAAQAAAEGGNPMAAGLAAGAYGALPPLARGGAEALARRFGLDPAMKVGGMTVAELIAAARAHGVPQDLAEAFQAGKGLLRNLQLTAETGVFGGLPYAQQKEAATAALERWAADLGDRIGPSMSREELGSRLVGELQQSLAAEKDALRQGFAALDKRIGGAGVAGGEAQSIARDIQEQYGSLIQKNPQVRKEIANAWGWVQALAKGEPRTFAQAQIERSQLLELERNAPDPVKDAAGGIYRALAGALDQGMMETAMKADPESAAMFRDLNARWQILKRVFNDPQSMVHQALAAKDLAKVPQLFVPATGKGTPELARQLARYAPGTFGAVRRFLFDQAFSPQKEDLTGFKLGYQRLSRFGEDYLAPMLGSHAEEARQLGLIGRAAHFDVNPSGSARGVASGADLAAIGSAVTLALTGNARAALVVASEPAARWLLARALLNPRLQDALVTAASQQGRLAPLAMANIVASELGGEVAGQAAGKRQ